MHGYKSYSLLLIIFSATLIPTFSAKAVYRDIYKPSDYGWISIFPPTNNSTTNPNQNTTYHPQGSNPIYSRTIQTDKKYYQRGETVQITHGTTNLSDTNPLDFQYNQTPYTDVFVYHNNILIWRDHIGYLSVIGTDTLDPLETDEDIFDWPQSTNLIPGMIGTDIPFTTPGKYTLVGEYASLGAVEVSFHIVPEPATISLLGLFSLLLIRKPHSATN